MGIFEEDDRKDKMELKLMNEQIIRQIESIKEADEIRRRQAEEEIKRINENNKYKIKKMLQDNQKDEDNTRREYILKLQHYVGYNLNPYNMSSSELKYWYEKIKREVKEKEYELDRYNNRINNRINSYNSYSNNFYY